MFLRTLLYFAALIAVSVACPEDAAISQRCVCQTSYSGLSLDCSGHTFNETMELLRPVRSQLGLLQELTFQNASIGYLPAKVFEGFYVKKLDLSFNDIQEIDPQAFKGLENILQILLLKRNKLHEVPGEAVNGMTGLLQLDLSNNTIGSLATEILSNVPKLYDLNLADNKICKAYKDAFKNVKFSLQTLNLGGNCLTKVPAPALRGFQQLLALHLHNNKIPILEPLQFMNMPALYLMNLAGNEIQKLHRQTFLNVPNLKFLYLGDNKIEELEPQQFQPFDSLELLDLSRNKLGKISAGVFSNLPKLAQLYLTGNQIEEIEGNAFANSSIVILLLNENKLKQVTGEMFFGLNSVQQFSLRNNEISFVAQNAFYQLPSLVVLDLSYNNISALYPATFLAQLGLFMLDLSSNNLPAVPTTAFNQRIITIVLQENPLVCTERIHVIQNGNGLYVPGTPDHICHPDGDVPNLQLQPSFTQSPIVFGGLNQSGPASVGGGGAIDPVTGSVNGNTQGGSSDGAPIFGIFPSGNLPTNGANNLQPQPPLPTGVTEEPNFSSRGQGFIDPLPSSFIGAPLSGPGAIALPPARIPALTDGAGTSNNNLPSPQFPNNNNNNNNNERQHQPAPPGPTDPFLPVLDNNTVIINQPGRIIPQQVGGVNGLVFNLPTSPTTTTDIPYLQPAPPLETKQHHSSGPIITAGDNNAANSIPSPAEILLSGNNTLPDGKPIPHLFPGIPSNAGVNFGSAFQLQTGFPHFNRSGGVPGVGSTGSRNGQQQQPEPYPGAFRHGGPGSGFPGGIRPPVVLFTGIVTTPIPTLPPGIITSDKGDTQRSNKGQQANIFRTGENGRSLATVVPPELRTIPSKKPPIEPEPVGSIDQKNGDSSASLSASTTIAVCLTAVVVVMLVVFTTLCIVRRRAKNAKKSVESSTASRTSAYVAAQAAAARAASFHGGSIYGTATYLRETPPRPPTRNGLHPNGASHGFHQPNTWIYAPSAATYATAMEYYK